MLCSICSCSNDSDEPSVEVEFKISPTEISLSKDGESKYIYVQCIGKPQVKVDDDWLIVGDPVANDDSGVTFQIEVSAPANALARSLTATVTVVASNATGSVNVIQAPALIQEDEEDIDAQPLLSSTAMQIAADMYAGINIGNTMETPNYEGAWNCPVVNLDYIKGLKNLGFNAVRIPCAWDSHISDASTNTINSAWLDRVSEVVGWIVAQDMYAVLNIHWDGGWLENSCVNGYSATVNQKQHDYWTQIANKLNEYDEHLLFAAMNEPNVGSDAASKKASVDAIIKYQQTMLDAVRATGGNNASRVLVMQGPCTDIDITLEGQYALPTDIIADRLMIETHFYGPYQFNMMEKDESWGNTFWYWGSDNHVAGSDHNSTWGEEDYVRTQMQNMKTRFVDRGIPGIIGEYGVCYNREGTTGIDVEKWRSSVRLWNKVVARESKNAGMVPFYWETGGDIDRSNGSVINTLQLDGVFEGVTEGKYPF